MFVQRKIIKNRKTMSEYIYDIYICDIHIYIYISFAINYLHAIGLFTFGKISELYQKSVKSLLPLTFHELAIIIRHCDLEFMILCKECLFRDKKSYILIIVWCLEDNLYKFKKKFLVKHKS